MPLRTEGLTYIECVNRDESTESLDDLQGVVENGSDGGISLGRYFTRSLEAELRENPIDIEIGIDILGAVTCQLHDMSLELGPSRGDFLVHRRIQASRR